MDLAALIAKMDDQRKGWAVLPDGKRVQFRRPLEADFWRFRDGLPVGLLIEYACGWEGFTEADLIGAAIGSSDAVAFHTELWSFVCRDNVDYVAPLGDALVNAIKAHLEAKDSAAKNLRPS